MGAVTVDFIVKDQPHGGFSLILLEEGPWEEDTVTANLRRIQNRLYDCIDIILDGLLAEQYPDSVGKPVAIELRAKDVHERELREFFDAFSSSVLELPDYANALSESKIVPGILFDLQFKTILLH